MTMIDRLSHKTNPKFQLNGLNHMALVCKDMKKTVDFYQGVLGMPLVKTCDLPFGWGQHFFFDIGNGASLAFFWFPDAPEVEKGITMPKTLMGEMGNITTAIGSLNHVAFAVDADKVPEYKAKLEAAGVPCGPILHHDDTPQSFSFGDDGTPHPTRWVSSVYFKDPDGIQLEFAGWTRMMKDGDVQHEPASWEDRHRYLEMQKNAPPPPTPR
jgi:catechol 2,3-dioxygenase-like lactoylglutathione lyase family enzyme